MNCKHSQSQVEADHMANWALIWFLCCVVSVVILLFGLLVDSGWIMVPAFLVGVVTLILCFLAGTLAVISHKEAIFALYDGCPCGTALSQGEYNHHKDALIARDVEKKHREEYNRAYQKK